MSGVGRRRKHRVWPWVIGGVLVVVVAGLAALAWTALYGGPSPRLATLEREPMLDAPVPATMLGQVSQESSWGLGFGPDTVASIVTVYEVDLTPQEALDAWRVGYEDQYGPPDYDDGAPVSTFAWFPDQMIVTVQASDQVEDAAARAAVRQPTAGRTVVTVAVSGAG
jgi:hypothetical protein